MRSTPKCCPKLSERLGRVVVAAALFALPVVGVAALGCGAPADQVELHLYPCMFAGEQPRSVLVEITGLDAAGEVVEVFETGFDNIDASVFSDGYATVGYDSDPAVVRASFRLGWSSNPTIESFADAEAQVSLDMLAVPAPGQVLALGDGAGGGCEPIAGDGDGDATGDGDGDLSGDGDGDPSGDGDGDATGDGDGDPTGDGDGDGDPTGDGDGDPTGDGDGDPTGDGDGDPGNLPMIGDACDTMSYPFYCVPELNAYAGTPLYCDPNSEELVMTDVFVAGCQGLCPIGSSTPVDACAGFGSPGNCLCYPDAAETCAMAQLGCNGDAIKLCLDGDVVVGQCNGCAMEDGYYTCTR